MCLFSEQTAVFTPYIVILITITWITGVCTGVGHPACALTTSRWCSTPGRHFSGVSWHPPCLFNSFPSYQLWPITLILDKLFTLWGDTSETRQLRQTLSGVMNVSWITALRLASFSHVFYFHCRVVSIRDGAERDSPGLPVAPFSPGGPRGPKGPGLPGNPTSPFIPIGPGGPIGPYLPGGPSGPVLPLLPFGPAWQSVWFFAQICFCSRLSSCSISFCTKEDAKEEFCCKSSRVKRFFLDISSCPSENIKDWLCFSFSLASKKWKCC